MGRSFAIANERWGEDGFHMDDADEKDESLSLCDLPITLVEHENPHFLLEIKPRAAESPIAAADDQEFDFGSSGGFSNSAAHPPPDMCLADEIFYQGQLLPARLSVSSDNASTGFNRRRGSSSGSFVNFRSSRSSSSRSQCSSSSVTNNSLTTTSAARNSRLTVPNLFHSHPSPTPQIKTSPTTFRQTSIRQKSSSTWDFFRLGVVKTPGMELEDLKHRSSTRRNSSVSRTNSRTVFIPAAASKESRVKAIMGGPRASIWIERKSGGILSGVGCKCSLESTVAPAPKAAVVVRRKGNSKNIPAQVKTMMELRLKKVEKEKEEEEKLALSRHRTFEWLKELSHETFPCEVKPRIP